MTYSNRINGVELTTLIYIVITTVMTMFWWNSIADRTSLLVTRAIVLAGMALFYALHRIHPCKLTVMLRTMPAMFLLIVWYPETYTFCSNLPYQDHIFAGIDQSIFGFQPALHFQQALPSTFWCEAFCLGYYAYYYMMFASIFFYFVRRFKDYDRVGFTFLACFFSFYLIFEFLPVAGPQFYFKAVGVEAEQTGVFPAIGYYFQDHLEMLHMNAKGLFSNLVKTTQEFGERPTAAFPSSHVGMSTVTMIFALRSGNRWLFWLQVPIYILLCFATVYIMAHYAIDSFCGFIAAILLYVFWDRIYTLWRGRCAR